MQTSTRPQGFAAQGWKTTSPQGFFYEHALSNQQIGILLCESRVLHCQTVFFFLLPALP
jgi:hypothetical protein